MMMDLVNFDDERRLWRFGYVDGHDGLIHRVNGRGYTVCGMGRALKHLYVEHGPTTCFRCGLLEWPAVKKLYAAIGKELAKQCPTPKKTKRKTRA